MKSAAGVARLKTGNPALYCNPDSTDVEAAPGAPPTAQEEPVKAAPSASTTAPKAPAPKLDASTFDIVKATQYGARERVEQLVEGGYDVNQRDDENVTLLHWAAINNRGAKIHGLTFREICIHCIQFGICRKTNMFVANESLTEALPF